MPPTPQKLMAPPPVQAVIPNFNSSFISGHPFFYFLHRIDVQNATLTVEVIGPNLTFTFTHSRAIRSEGCTPSDIGSALERKTVGFLALVKKGDNRHILAWAESGHGLGRSGDLLDAPNGSPVLASELWTRRVIRVGNILGIKMNRSFDNMNNSADPSLDVEGSFQGSHVEVKLAVHAAWVMLETFNITKELDHVTKEDLQKLKGIKWGNGSEPSFEVYFSRKNCPTCGNIVKGLSELTGIEIKMIWKDRLTLKQYYKPPKNKEQAKAQRKAFVMQRDVADFDEVVSRRAEREHGDSSDNGIVISEPDTPMSLDEDSPEGIIVIDDDTPPYVADMNESGNEAIDLTKNETDEPPTNERPVSKTIQERQEFMQEMRRHSVKANFSPVPEPPSRQGSTREKPLTIEEAREEIRKPLPTEPVEVEFLPADQWENSGSQYRRRFLHASGSSADRARSASPRRQAPAVRKRSVRRRGVSSIRSVNTGGTSRAEVAAASQVGHPRARRTNLPPAKRHSVLRLDHEEIAQAISAESELQVVAATEHKGQSRPAGPTPKVPEIIELDKSCDEPMVNTTPDLVEKATQSPTRLLFPQQPAPRFDLTQASFPSPKPALNARPKDAPEPLHHDTPQLKKSYAENTQKTEVFHYPTPEASSSSGPVGQNLSTTLLPSAISKQPKENATEATSKAPAAPNKLTQPAVEKTPKPSTVFDYPKPPPSRLPQVFAEERERRKRPRLTTANLDRRDEDRKQTATPKPPEQMGTEMTQANEMKEPEEKRQRQTPNRPRMGVDM